MESIENAIKQLQQMEFNMSTKDGSGDTTIEGVLAELLKFTESDYSKKVTLSLYKDRRD